MGAKEKRKKELELITLRRKQEVIEAAKEVFADVGIDKATIKDIALRAEIGVASVYRYYTNKKELINVVAIDYVSAIGVTKKNSVEVEGVEGIKIFLKRLTVMSEEEERAFNFLDEAKRYLRESDVMKAFNDLHVREFESLVKTAAESGKIKPLIDYNQFATSIISMLTLLIRKNCKNDIERKSEVDLFVEMTMKYIEK